MSLQQSSRCQHPTRSSPCSRITTRQAASPASRPLHAHSRRHQIARLPVRARRAVPSREAGTPLLVSSTPPCPKSSSCRRMTLTAPHACLSSLSFRGRRHPIQASSNRVKSTQRPSSFFALSSPNLSAGLFHTPPPSPTGTSRTCRSNTRSSPKDKSTHRRATLREWWCCSMHTLTTALRPSSPCRDTWRRLASTAE